MADQPAGENSRSVEELRDFVRQQLAHRLVTEFGGDAVPVLRSTKITKKRAPSPEQATARRHAAATLRQTQASEPVTAQHSRGDLLTTEDERHLSLLIECGNWIFDLEEGFSQAHEASPTEVETVLLLLLQFEAMLPDVHKIAERIDRQHLSWWALIHDQEFQQPLHSEIYIPFRNTLMQEHSAEDAEEQLVRISILASLLSELPTETLALGENEIENLFPLQESLPERLRSNSEIFDSFTHEIKRRFYAAEQQMIISNSGLVTSVVRKTNRRGMPFEDLHQEGQLGLIRAVEKFDHRMGYKFSTYAVWWIRQAIIRATYDKARTIRLPVHMVEKLDRYNKVSNQLLYKLGRNPTASEIAREAGITEEEVAQLAKAGSIRADPLDVHPEPDESSTLEEFVEDDPALRDYDEPQTDPMPTDNVDAGLSPEEYADHQALRSDLSKVLAGLSERERQILEKRYGLTGDEPMTLEAIGRDFDVTRERIRQIEAKALRQLRHPSRSTRLRDYIE